MLGQFQHNNLLSNVNGRIKERLEMIFLRTKGGNGVFNNKIVNKLYENLITA